MSLNIARTSPPFEALLAAVAIAATLFSAPPIARPEIRDGETEWSVDGTRWARLARPLFVSWQHAPYAGQWDASGLLVRYYPESESKIGFSLGLRQVLGGRGLEAQGPMGNSIYAFRSSEVTLLVRTPNDASPGGETDYELLAAWSGIVENDPLQNILTTLRARGGYRGAVGATVEMTRHEFFAEGLMATNTIAPGISNPYDGVEGERGLYGPRTLRLYAGIPGYLQVEPETTSGLESFCRSGRRMGLHLRLACPPLRRRGSLCPAARVVGTDRTEARRLDRAGQGFFVDVTGRGSEGTSPVAGVGVRYQFSR